MAIEKRGISRARRIAEIQMQRAEVEHRIAMLRRRIDLAQAGVKAYEGHKIAEAVKNFHTYLRILEDWKGVADGGLLPSHFDKKADVAELLLISGVYWDLAKLYDRTSSPDKVKDFHRYMEKYIMFAKGMPFQAVCGETLRKYIAANKPIHMNEFKRAYKMLGKPQCFIATSLLEVSDSQTLPTLRAWRDQSLRKSKIGRGSIALYYRFSPRLAKRLDGAPTWVRRVVALGLDQVARLIARRLPPGA
jgi:hypothetical protein